MPLRAPSAPFDAERRLCRMAGPDAPQQAPDVQTAPQEAGERPPMTLEDAAKTAQEHLRKAGEEIDRAHKALDPALQKPLAAKERAALAATTGGKDVPAPAEAKQPEAPKTNRERFDREIDGALKTLNDPKTSAVQKLSAVFSLLAAIGGKFNAVFQGTLDNAISVSSGGKTDAKGGDKAGGRRKWRPSGDSLRIGREGGRGEGFRPERRDRDRDDEDDDDRRERRRERPAERDDGVDFDRDDPSSIDNPTEAAAEEDEGFRKPKLEDLSDAQRERAALREELYMMQRGDVPGDREDRQDVRDRIRELKGEIRTLNTEIRLSNRYIKDLGREQDKRTRMVERNAPKGSPALSLEGDVLTADYGDGADLSHLTPTLKQFPQGIIDVQGGKLLITLPAGYWQTESVVKTSLAALPAIGNVPPGTERPKTTADTAKPDRKERGTDRERQAGDVQRQLKDKVGEIVADAERYLEDRYRATMTNMVATKVQFNVDLTPEEAAFRQPWMKTEEWIVRNGMRLTGDRDAALRTADQERQSADTIRSALGTLRGEKAGLTALPERGTKTAEQYVAELAGKLTATAGRISQIRGSIKNPDYGRVDAQLGESLKLVDVLKQLIVLSSPGVRIDSDKQKA